MPGADESLRALSEAGIPLGLATSDDRRMSLLQLEAFGWRERFAFMAFGDTALRRKPDPWMAQEFSRVLKLDLSRVAVIGDTPADYGMARAAGVSLYVKVTGSIEGLAPFLLGRASAAEAPFTVIDLSRRIPG
jgi:phosphoglycolate phosphatase